MITATNVISCLNIEGWWSQPEQHIMPAYYVCISKAQALVLLRTQTVVQGSTNYLCSKTVLTVAGCCAGVHKLQLS